jgi:sugar phosphate isomerase/epimerase
MKLSCLPVSLFQDMISGKLSIAEWASYAKQLGLDGIDLSVLCIKNRTPVCVDAARTALDDAGMRCVMITTYPDFTHPDRLYRERELAFAAADTALAYALGADYLRITAGQCHELSDEDKALRIVKEYFLRLQETADKFGVRLLFENHSKPGAWEKPDYLFDTRRFLKFAEMVKDTDVRINFDTANTIADGEDALEVFKAVLPQVETIHVNDLKAPHCLDFVVCGCGIAPIQQIFRKAKKAGFDGWVCIEEAGFKGFEGIAQAVEFTRRAWDSA